LEINTLHETTTDWKSTDIRYLHWMDTKQWKTNN